MIFSDLLMEMRAGPRKHFPSSQGGILNLVVPVP